MQEAEIIKDLDTFLEQLVADDRFSGAVLSELYYCCAFQL